MKLWDYPFISTEVASGALYLVKGVRDDRSPAYPLAQCCGNRVVNCVEDFLSDVELEDKLDDYPSPNYFLQKNAGICLGFNLQGEVPTTALNSVIDRVKIAPNVEMFLRLRRKYTPLEGAPAVITQPVNYNVDNITFIYTGYIHSTLKVRCENILKSKPGLVGLIVTKRQTETFDFRNGIGVENIVYESAFAENFRYPTYGPKLKLFILKGCK